MLNPQEQEQRANRMMRFALARGGRNTLIALAAVLFFVILIWSDILGLDPLGKREAAHWCQFRYSQSTTAADSAVVDRSLYGKGSKPIACGELRRSGALAH